jgi:hypothetical protein
VQIGEVGPIGQNGAYFHQPARHADEDEAILCGEAPNFLPVQRQEPRPDNDEGLGAPTRCRLECAIKIAGLTHLERLELHLQGARGALRLSKLGSGVIGIPQNGDARHQRHRVLE